MGYIKEPKGVDFIIQSKPLTNEERKGISKFIQEYKAKNADKKAVRKSSNTSAKQKKNVFTKSNIASKKTISATNPTKAQYR